MTGQAESLASPRLGLAFACMLIVSGLTNTFPVLLPALLDEFGGSRAATASVVTLLWVGGALLGPVTGWLVARWNPRLVVVLGLAAAALGLGLGALAPTLSLFTLAVGVGGGIGVGLTGMVAQAALLADQYVHRRGVAMGIAFSGSMAGYVVAPPVQWLVVRFGWRGALWVYVGAVLVLIAAAAIILPPRLRAGGSAPGIAPDASRSLQAIARSRPFWILAVLFTTPPLLGYLATTQHALYFAARGYSPAEASLLLGVGGLLAASGRVVFGIMADRVGAPLAGFVSFGSTFVGLGCLLGMEVWPVRLLAYGYVFFLFSAMGSRATIVSVLVGRITPPAHYGIVFGLLGIGNNLGAGLGPVLSGVLYDRTGSYLPVYLAALAVLLLGITALAAFCAITRESG